MKINCKTIKVNADKHETVESLKKFHPNINDFKFKNLTDFQTKFQLRNQLLKTLKKFLRIVKIDNIMETSIQQSDNLIDFQCKFFSM